jgi:hypothetical protein
LNGREGGGGWRGGAGRYTSVTCTNIITDDSKPSRAGGGEPSGGGGGLNVWRRRLGGGGGCADMGLDWSIAGHTHSMWDGVNSDGAWLGFSECPQGLTVKVPVVWWRGLLWVWRP